VSPATPWRLLCGIALLIAAGRSSATNVYTVLQEIPGPFAQTPTGAGAVAVSPDGSRVYVAGGGPVDSYQLDPAGGLRPLAQTAFELLAESSAVSPDGAHLYLVNGQVGALFVLARDPSTEALLQRQTLDCGCCNSPCTSYPWLEEAAAVAVTPDGAQVLVGAGDHVAVLARDVTTGAVTFIGVGFASRTSALAVSSDGAFVYATGSDSGTLVAFQRAAPAGTLTVVDVEQQGVGGVDGLLGVRSLAISPDGAHLYASGDVAVAIFSRDQATGALHFLGTAQSGALGSTRGPIAVTPDGRHVYAGLRDHLPAQAGANAVAIFQRDAITGLFGVVGSRGNEVAAGIDGLVNISSIVVGPDGGWVYVVGRDAGALSVFRRNAADGTLSFIEGWRGGVGTFDVNRVVLSADDAYVYAISSNGGLIAAFARDAHAGTLSLVDTYLDGHGGVAGLVGVTDATMSPDGESLYVANGRDKSVAIFSRDRTTGRLSPAGGVQNGIGGVDGLEGVRAVAVSAGGRSLYSASDEEPDLVSFSGTYGDHAVDTFARDPSSGALTFAGHYAIPRTHSGSPTRPPWRSARTGPTCTSGTSASRR